jgi:hypothetical protein
MSERMRGFERDTLSAAWHAPRVWFTHVFANLALVAVFYGWLLIPDRRGWQVTGTFLVGLAWLTFALWLHAATFQYFAAAHTAPESWTMSWRRSARNIPAFAICVAILILVIWLMGLAFDRQGQLGGWFHHLAPGFVRSRVSVRAMTRLTHIKIVIVFLVLLPLYLFPFLREGAVRGFGAFTRGWASAARSFWRLRWWITWIVLFLIGHLPFHLAFAKPHPGTVIAQAVNMVLRLGAAYLLLITVYVLVASAVGRLRRNEAPAKPEPVPVEAAPKV